MINLDDRIKYYLGDTNYTDYEPDKIDPVIHDYPFHTSQNYSVLKRSYVEDINRYKSYIGNDFWCQCGDLSYMGGNIPILVKTRKANCSMSKGIIANLNSSRHWQYCERAIKHNISWEEKQNNVIWRGATTGIYGNIFIYKYHYKTYSRENFVKDYHTKYDIGFSSIVQSCGHLREYVKKPCAVVEMLNCKYIPIIDGNDKSSSLNWVLASNSVPIMPKSDFHSWLCEPWLVPNVHYVEVKEDFSDFDEKIEWCKTHDDECKEIAYNGQKFIVENFSNLEDAKHIEKEIIKRTIK